MSNVIVESCYKVTNLKCEFNLPLRAVDGITAFMKEIRPNSNEMAIVTRLKSCLRVLNFRTGKSIRTPTVACYFARMQKA